MIHVQFGVKWTMYSMSEIQQPGVLMVIHPNLMPHHVTPCDENSNLHPVKMTLIEFEVDLMKAPRGVC